MKDATENVRCLLARIALVDTPVHSCQKFIWNRALDSIVTVSCLHMSTDTIPMTREDELVDLYVEYEYCKEFISNIPTVSEDSTNGDIENV